MMAIRITPTVAWMYCASCIPLMSATENGNSMTMPDADSAMPPRITDQKISFCPALKRRAGG